MKTTICICALQLFVFSGFGQVVDSAEVVREVDSLINAWNQFSKDGQYDSIVESAVKAAEKVEKNIGQQQATYANIQQMLGAAYRALGQYTEAETCYLAAVAIRESIFGKENPDYAASINGLGTVYLDVGQYDKAEPLFQQALAVGEKVYGKESIAYAASLNNLGILHYYSGQYDKAEPFFLEARALRGKLLGQESSGYASSVENLANLYTDLGQYDRAEQFYLEALEIKEKVAGKESAAYAFTLSNLSTLYSATGNYLKAEQTAREALIIREKTLGQEHPDYALSLSNLAGVYLGMGKYEAAEPLYLRCKAIREIVFGKENPDYAGTVNDLAIVYHNLGDYETTESFYLESLDIREKLLGKEHPEYAWSLNNLAVLYMDMGNYLKAKQFQLEALAIREKVFGKEHPEYAMNLNTLAVIYAHSGKYEQAEPLHLEALAVKEKILGKSHKEYAGDLINLADLYRSWGKYGKAEPLFLEAKTIFERDLNNREYPYYMSCLASLGNLYLETGQYDKAAPLLLEAKSLRGRLLGEEHLSYAMSHADLARLYWKTDQPGLAAQSFHKASTIRQSLLSRASRHLSEREMLSYTRAFVQDLHWSYSFAVSPQRAPSGHAGVCFDNTLYYKGFLLNVSNQVRRLTLTNPRLEEQLNLQRANLRLLEKEYAKPRAEQQSIAMLEEQANSLEKVLVSTAAGFGEAVRQVSWKEVQFALKPGEAALEFIHFNYYNPESTDSVLYAALLLKPGMDQPVFIPLFEVKQLTALLPAVEGKINSDQINELYGANALYRLIWAPLESPLADVRKVYYSPGGLLHRLNLAALPAGPQTVLSDRHEMVTLGSTRQLVLGNHTPGITPAATALIYGAIQFDMDSTAYQPRPTIPSGPRGLSFNQTDSTLRGDSWEYLKWSEKEVENVRTTLGQAGLNTQSLKGWQATEESFKQIGQSGPSPRILHISTHGFFFPDPQTADDRRLTADGAEPVFKLSEHPMIRSGLILAGANHAWKTGRPLGNREDGILTAYEISQLDLRNTELVVLSACETGLGHIEGNEGVYGLQRAFKIAGAQTLIMSLWQVPDYQTQELMTAFYQKWLLGKMPVRQALQSAQKEMRDKGYEPYYWAGFVVVE